MCGIAGIINFSGQPVAGAELKLMTDAIKHRGPDGEGFYIHENVGFGHRRLAIIDLSEAGAQPMTRFGCTITYNGEMYNYLEVRRELEKKGISFSTKTDTEVILAAYHVWGTECVQRFNGMWAFAIHDEEKEQLFCSRDRFGEKPFYYSFKNNRFIFCSEIKGILAIHAKAVANLDAVVQYLVFEKSETQELTFFESIKKLQASHNAEIHTGTGKCKTWNYFDIQNYELPILSEQDHVPYFQEQFERSVSWRLRSDVQVGTCLSGGLDSSNIAAVAAKLRQKEHRNFPMIAVTATSEDERNNEAAFAGMVSKQFGLSWKVCKPDTLAFDGAMNKIVYHQEEPFHSPSVAMQYFVMQAASEAGLSVLLDGQGADEILLGYPLHLGIMLRQLPLPKAMTLAKKAIDNYDLQIKILGLLWGYHSHPLIKAWRQKHQWKNWLNKEALARLQMGWETQMEASIQSSMSAYQAFDMSMGNLSMLLRYEDKNSMAFSIESRLPYLDHQLAAWCVALPSASKIHNGWSKYLLRQAMIGHVDEAIIWRKKKIGFEAPAKIWFANKERFQPKLNQSKLLAHLGLHGQLPTNADKWWRIVSIALWEETFDVTF
jgi:asparagine synthase (glutamine-hydrolysing)